MLAAGAAVYAGIKGPSHRDDRSHGEVNSAGEDDPRHAKPGEERRGGVDGGSRQHAAKGRALLEE